MRQKITEFADSFEDAPMWVCVASAVIVGCVVVMGLMFLDIWINNAHYFTN
jgi:hypothetical protein